MKTATKKDIHALFKSSNVKTFPIIVKQVSGEAYVSYSQVADSIEAYNSNHVKVLEVKLLSDGWWTAKVIGAAYNRDEETGDLELFNAYGPVYIFLEAGTLLL